MFESKWICVLTAGDTVDDREIDQQILNDVAETYSPQVYNARVNIDHNKNSTRLGSVLAAKVDGDQLFVKLKPNAIMLSLIQQGQYLHCSCELKSNFAKKGKWYLIGLAFTDEPASLGTSEMHLSANKNIEYFSTGEILQGEKPSLFKNLLSKNKDESMNEKAVLEALSQINETNAATVETLSKLNESVTNLSLGSKQNKDEENASEKGTKDIELSSELEELTEKFTAQKTDLETKTTELSAKTAEVQSLTEKLSQMTDEQHRDEATGGKSEEEEYY